MEWNGMCPKSNNIRCDVGKHQCIYNPLQCDGHSNCPLGSDQKDCPTIVTIEVNERLIFVKHFQLIY
jgi:hypothetical protein